MCSGKINNCTPTFLETNYVLGISVETVLFLAVAIKKAQRRSLVVFSVASGS